MTTIGQAFQDNQIDAAEARELLTQAQQRLTERRQLATPDAMTAELTSMIQAHEATLPTQTIDEAATARAIVSRFGTGGDSTEAVQVAFTTPPRPTRATAVEGTATQPTAPVSRIDQQASAARSEFEAASRRLVEAARQLDAGTISATVRTYSTSLRSELGLTGEASQTQTDRQESQGTLPDPAAASQAVSDTSGVQSTGGKDQGGGTGGGTGGGSSTTTGGTQSSQDSADARTSATATLTAFRATADRSARTVDIPNGARDAGQRTAYMQALTDFAVAARQYLDAEAIRGIRSSGQGMQELQELGILDSSGPLYTREQAQTEMDNYRALLTPVLNGLMENTTAYNDLLNVIAASAAATMSGSAPIDPNASGNSSGSSFTPPRPTGSGSTTSGNSGNSGSTTATGGKGS